MSASQSQDKCFWPDGSTSDQIPCDSSAKTSNCCATGDACLANNLCFSTQFFLYRGGCTDSLFPPAFCAQNCVKGDSDVQKSLSNMGGFTVITPCADVFNGQSWACTADPQSCIKGNFTLPASNFTAVGITNTTNSKTSSTGTNSTVTITATASSTANKGVSTGALGAAVAVPTVVLSILALAAFFFLFRERKKRVHAEKSAQNWANAAANPQAGHIQDFKGHGMTPVAEVGGDTSRTYELASSDGQGSYTSMRP